MRTGDFLAGLLVGALIGASVGLLFAPEAGEETRERIKVGARRTAERARGLLRRGESEQQEDEA